jgi:hypothetical protein
MMWVVILQERWASVVMRKRVVFNEVRVVMMVDAWVVSMSCVRMTRMFVHLGLQKSVSVAGVITLLIEWEGCLLLLYALVCEFHSGLKLILQALACFQQTCWLRDDVVWEWFDVFFIVYLQCAISGDHAFLVLFSSSFDSSQSLT